MKINVSNLNKYEEKEFVFLKDFNTLSIGQELIMISNPVELNVRAILSGEEVIVKGKIKVNITLECNRCLENYCDKIEIEFVERFVKGTQFLSDLDDYYLYSDNFIEFDELVIQNIILSLPAKRICSSSCKGLCPLCGINLNNSFCECVSNDIDVRLEKLKDLLK